jgi:hypothetical protein
VFKKNIAKYFESPYVDIGPSRLNTGMVCDYAEIIRCAHTGLGETEQKIQITG